jgi:hypothetical protein
MAQNFINISTGSVYQSTYRNASQLGTNFSASGRHGFSSTLGQSTFPLASLRYRRQRSLTSQGIGTFIPVQCSVYYRFWRHLSLFILSLLRLHSTTRGKASSMRFLDHTYVTPHTQETPMPPGGIRTRNPSRREVEDICIRPRGHWDGLRFLCQTL